MGEWERGGATTGIRRKGGRSVEDEVEPKSGRHTSTEAGEEVMGRMDSEGGYHEETGCAGQLEDKAMGVQKCGATCHQKNTRWSCEEPLQGRRAHTEMPVRTEYRCAGALATGVLRVSISAGGVVETSRRRGRGVDKETY